MDGATSIGTSSVTDGQYTTQYTYASERSRREDDAGGIDIRASAARDAVGLDTDTDGEEEEKRRYFAKVEAATDRSASQDTDPRNNGTNRDQSSDIDKNGSQTDAQLLRESASSGLSQSHHGHGVYSAVVSSPAPRTSAYGIGAEIASHSPIEPHNNNNNNNNGNGDGDGNGNDVKKEPSYLSRNDTASEGGLRIAEASNPDARSRVLSPHPEATFDISGLNGSNSSPPSTSAGGRDTARTGTETLDGEYRAGMTPRMAAVVDHGAGVGGSMPIGTVFLV